MANLLDTLGGLIMPAAKGARIVRFGTSPAEADAAEAEPTKQARAECMRKLHADPAFAAANAERARERMRKLHADQAFERRRIAALKAANKKRRRCRE